MLKFSGRYVQLFSVVAISALSISLLPAGAAIAQEGAAGAIEEIVVTARKRAESLLEIPESVSVITGADIDRQNIWGLEDVGFQVPNLNLSTRLDGFPNVSVRGLGAFGNTQGVGFYLDDVQLFSDASSRFGDLERIEVLKGPQGTLYGGSNIGGAVKFVSARPDPESMFGRVKGVAGDQGVFDVEGSLNMPLGQGDWALRAFAFWSTNDGYLSNPNPARLNGIAGTNDEDIGNTEESGVRVSLAGPLGDNLSAYVSVRSNEFEGPNNTWIRELDESDLQHSNVVPSSFNPRHDRNTTSGMVELNWELDGYDITSVSSWTTTESFRFTDLDQKEEYLLSLFRPEDMDVLTQEIRFTSTADGPVQWLGGAYYSKYDEKMDSDLVWYDTVIYSGGEISGPLGCAAGTPQCSGRLGRRDGYRGRGNRRCGADPVREAHPRQEPSGCVSQCDRRAERVGMEPGIARRPLEQRHAAFQHRSHRQRQRHRDSAQGFGHALAERGLHAVRHGFARV